MSLVFKRTEPKKVFTQLHKIIFGLPKIGKSTFCAQMKEGNKEPLFLSTEDGLSELGVYVANFRTFEKFLELVEYIKTNKNKVIEKYSCFIFDIASDLDTMCEKYTCEKAGVSDLSDGAWGKLYSEHKKSFQENIKELMDILPCVFVTHAKDKEINYRGKTVTTAVPSLSSKNFDFLNGKVDAIGYIHTGHDGKTAITFTPSLNAQAGCRQKQLRDKIFILNPDNMQDSYNQIVSVYNGGSNEECKTEIDRKLEGAKLAVVQGKK